MKEYYRLQIQLFSKRNKPKTNALVGGTLRVPMFDPRAPASYHFRKAEDPTDVYPPIVIANPKTALTDCIYGAAAATGFQLVISNLLKNILEQQRHSGLQFFSTPVMYRDVEYPYWMMNPFKVDREYIDFAKSTVFICKSIGTPIEEIHVQDQNTYEALIKSHKDNIIKIMKPVIRGEAPD